MRKNLVLGALMLMIVATNSLSDMGPTCTSNMSVDSDSTVLTYFIEHVPAQSEDYIEIVLEVLTHSGRLVEALASAQKTVEEI